MFAGVTLCLKVTIVYCVLLISDCHQPLPWHEISQSVRLNPLLCLS